jgi:site-specific recombinase XerD
LNKNDAKLIKTYREMLFLRGKSKEDADSACRSVRKFSNFLATRRKTLLTAESPDCEDWLEILAEEVADRTRAADLSMLHSFYKKMIEIKRANYDPTVFSKVPKTWTDQPRSIAQKKLNAGLDRARAKARAIGASLLTIRNWAIVEFFYGSGVRRNELLLLNDDDVSVETGDALVHGKGGKDRLCPITEAAGDALTFYRENARAELKKRAKQKPEKALFLTKHGNRLGCQQIFNIVKEVLGDVSPHVLRHCNAQHRADNGECITNIQHDLGHSGPRPTMIYARKVSFHQLQSEHRRCHPRGHECAKSEGKSNAH